jgi:hypothetical protein
MAFQPLSKSTCVAFLTVTSSTLLFCKTLASYPDGVRSYFRNFQTTYCPFSKLYEVVSFVLQFFNQGYIDRARSSQHRPHDSLSADVY